MFPVTTTGKSAAVDQQIALADGAMWAVPEETPVAFVYNRRNYAVMMATPDDLTDFAIGLSLTEQVIGSVSEITALRIHHSVRGVDLLLSISEDRLERLDVVQRRRTMPGSAGCGICGLENADVLFAPLPRVAEQTADIPDAALLAAMTSLGDAQTLNARTRSVHAAAWADLDGRIQLVREDVGRHNALDKLLGALALSDQHMTQGFVLMSSRCSYELVQKAAHRGVTAMAFLSAPTLFALRRAQEANMALYVRTRAGVARISAS